MKIILTESQLNNIIDRFITYKLEPHEVKTSEEYGDSIFWVKKGNVIAEIDKHAGYFWVSRAIWKSVSNMFSLERKETQQVIKNWLEEHYELVRLTPEPLSDLNFVDLDEH